MSCCAKSSHSAPTGNTCRLLARDHAAPESTLALSKAVQPCCGGVRPLSWCSRPRSSTALPAGALDEPAVAGGVRPGIEASAAPVRTFGGPHLLERRPVIRRPLARKESPAVGALEAEVHLQTAVVRRIRIVPRTFEAVDPEQLLLVRRVQGVFPDG